MWAGELSLQRLQGLRQEGQQEVVLSNEEKLKQLAKAKQKTKTKDVVLLRDSGHITAPALEEVSSSALRARPVPVIC